MEQTQSAKSQSASDEGVIASTASHSGTPTDVEQIAAQEMQCGFPPARKPTDEQERELARLYAQTSTAVSEIARGFGIAESSAQRATQRHGAALRDRHAPEQRVASGPRRRRIAGKAQHG